MKRFFPILILTVTVIFGFTACNGIAGNDEMMQVDVKLSKFDKIYSQGAFNVHIMPGSGEFLVLEAESNLIPYIITEVKNQKLIIKTKQNFNYKRCRDINIFVHGDKLDIIDNNGSGNIYVENIEDSRRLKIIQNSSGSTVIDNILNCEEIDLRVSGSGDIRIGSVSNISETGNECDECNISVSGSGICTIDNLFAKYMTTIINDSGKVNLTGECRKANVKAIGSGEYNAYDLLTRIYNVRIGGSGNCHINVTDELTANINGSGNIYYIGNPPVINVNTNGMGRIIDKN